MEIPGEMQVQILHRHNLRITAACRSALDPEAGSKRRLTERDDRVFPKLCHGLSQSDGSGRLALSRGGRVDGCHKDQLSVLVVLYLLPEVIGKLCFVFSVKLQILFLDPRFFCNLCNGQHCRFLCNLNICLHSYPSC